VFVRGTVAAIAMGNSTQRVCSFAVGHRALREKVRADFLAKRAQRNSNARVVIFGLMRQIA